MNKTVRNSKFHSFVPSTCNLITTDNTYYSSLEKVPKYHRGQTQKNVIMFMHSSGVLSSKNLMIAKFQELK